jgi:REP element-mobilizing transposase RayT
MSNHRAALPDGTFHVYARAIPERSLFVDDDDRRAFVAQLATASHRHRLAVHAFCLMTTHYHAVIGAACADLSRGMQRLHSRHALRLNRRYRRFGHLFAERFAARVIEDESYLREACAYVLLNPVKAGLCDRIEDWPWSYCRFGLDAL